MWFKIFSIILYFIIIVTVQSSSNILSPQTTTEFDNICRNCNFFMDNIQSLSKCNPTPGATSLILGANFEIVFEINIKNVVIDPNSKIERRSILEISSSSGFKNKILNVDVVSSDLKVMIGYNNYTTTSELGPSLNAKDWTKFKISVVTNNLILTVVSFNKKCTLITPYRNIGTYGSYSLLTSNCNSESLGGYIRKIKSKFFIFSIINLY